MAQTLFIYPKKMKMKYLFLLLSFSVLTLQASTTMAETAWKLEKDKEGIKIWNRKNEGSSIKEFKVTTILNTTPEKLLAFLKNTSLYEKWMYKVDQGSVKVIKKVNENDFYTYMTISAPFVKTRESISHMVFMPADNKGIILINLEGAASLIPKNDKYVRIPKVKAHFKIVPLGNGKVELTHQAYAEPGGSIPDALANISSVDCPYYMFSKIKSLL